MSSSTNGKNERMALAATEKAKVWTSVRSRYCSVEPVNRRKYRHLSQRDRSLFGSRRGGFGSGKVGGKIPQFYQRLDYQGLASGHFRRPRKPHRVTAP